MIECKKCLTKNEDDVKFCKECGRKLVKQGFDDNQSVLAGKIKRIFSLIKSSVFFRTKKNRIAIVVIFISIILLVVLAVNSKVLIFKTAFNANNHRLAHAIFTRNIDDEVFIDNIETFIQVRAKNIKKNYMDENTTYKETKEMLSELDNYCSTSIISSEVDSIQSSRESYVRGCECLESGDKLNSILEFSNVIQEDNNYEDAQNKVNELTSSVKSVLLDEIRELEKKEDYASALSLISKYSRIFQNDTTIQDKKRKLTKLEEQARVDKLKRNQKMEVMNIRVSGVGFLNSNDVYATVKNKSKKVVREYVVGLLCFDKHGYPLVPEYNDDNLEMGRSTTTIHPGKTAGSNCYWTIFSAIRPKIKACVYSVDYHDGTTWQNPYYDHWLQDEQDRY